MQSLLRKRPSGSRLFLPAALVLVFLLAPVAGAQAAIDSHILISGDGEGTVIGIAPTPGELPINCSYVSPGPTTGTCDTEAQKPEEIAPFKSLSVKHEAEPGSKFGGWKVIKGGAIGCSQENPAAGSCSVTLSGEIIIEAKFEKDGEPVMVNNAGDGSGQVDCEVDKSGEVDDEPCKLSYPVGTELNLIPSPDLGSEFTQFENATGSAETPCTGTPTSCEFTVEEGTETEIDAVFDLESRELTIDEGGSGAGSVECDTGSGAEACTSEYLFGTLVTIIATADAGSEFTNWSGDCDSVSANECAVEMDDNKTVEVTFDKEPNVHISIEGSGSGTVVDNGANATEQGTPPVNCSYTAPGPETGDCDVLNGLFFGSLEGISVEQEAALGSEFVEWIVEEGEEGGADCNPGEAECTVFFPEPEIKITAVFELETRELTINEGGSGAGSVECEVESVLAACATEYPFGTIVTIIATPDGESDFGSWSGDCDSISANKCEVEIDDNKTVEVVFDKKPNVHIDIEGSGSGSVVDNGSNATEQGTPPVNCSYTAPGPETGDCDVLNGLFFGSLEGIAVKQEAAPGSEFVEWKVEEGTEGGADCNPGEAECTVFFPEPGIIITAVFELETRALTINEGGSGTGSVECEVESVLAACLSEYPLGTLVTIIATEDGGSEFTEWSGDCDSISANECEVEMDDNKTVEVVFNLIDRALTIDEGGTGSGVVECEVVGSEVEEACQPTYPDGTEVIVIGFEDPGSEFTEWGAGSDCDEIFENECELTMDGDKTVEAVFDLITHTLTVNKAGDGSGSVSCDGGGCDASYPEGTTVTLTASPDSNSTFAGWSGAGCSGTGSCVVTLDADTTVTASFDAKPPPPGCPENPALCPPDPDPKPGTLIANGAAFVKGNKALLKVRCRGERGARCRSTAKLVARVKVRGKKKNILIGKTPYNLPTNSAVRVLRVKLTGKGLKLVRRAGRRGLKVKLTGKGVKNRVVKLKQQGGKGKGKRQAKRGGRR